MPKKSRKPTVGENKPSTVMLANDVAASGWRDRIQVEMEKQKISQRKLSQMSGLGPTSIRFALKEAETCTTETLRRIANALNLPYHYLAAGVRTVVDGPEDQEFRRIKLLVVEDPSTPGKDGHDVVPVHANGHLPDQLSALKITNRAMVPEGQNSRQPDEYSLLPGDVVVYSTALRASVGSLAVVELHGQKEVRLIVQGDDGHLQAVASNHAFGRSRVAASQLIGKVVLVHRELRH